MIALDALHSNVLKTTFALTRKQYYSRMSELINAGLIIRKNGKYFLSSFGKIIYEAQMIIGISIQNYWKLKAVDSIDPSSASPQLPTEEYDKLIASLFER
jgi:predicted transcriptional regulator